MKRCPICGSGAELKNGFEYYAGHTGGVALGIGAGFFASLVHRSSGGHVAAHVHKEVTNSLYKKYICTNPSCKHVWFEK